MPFATRLSLERCAGIASAVKTVLVFSLSRAQRSVGLGDAIKSARPCRLRERLAKLVFGLANAVGGRCLATSSVGHCDGPFGSQGEYYSAIMIHIAEQIGNLLQNVVEFLCGGINLPIDRRVDKRLAAEAFLKPRSFSRCDRAKRRADQPQRRGAAMTGITYSTSGLNDRLLGVVAAIDAGGTNGALKLLTSSGATVCTFSLAVPCGTVSAGVLTFSGTLLDTSAAATGFVNAARVEDSNGSIVVSGLTIGTSAAGPYDGFLINGLGTTKITAGDVVSCPSATITGA